MFTSTTLDGADLIGAMFDNVDFSDIKTAKSLVSVDISLKDILGSHAKWVKTNGKEGRRAIFSKNDMNYQILSGVNLSSADFSLANMKGADLSKSECLIADFSYCDLRGSVFARADLRGVKFSRANLSGANLVAVDLSDVMISSRAGGGE